MFRFPLAAALVFINLYGADVTGKWTGHVVMDGRGHQVYLTLVQQGQTVTGAMSMGDWTNPAPIEAAELNDEGLTFEARDKAGRMVEFRMTLEDAADGALSGEASFTNSTANFTLCQVRDFGSGSLYQYLVHPITEGIFFSAVVQPMPRRLVKPEYTEEARAAGLEGRVVVRVEIDKNGNVANAEVQRGLGMGLDEKALEAVRQGTFTRAYRDFCRPIAVQLTTEVEFSLPRPGNAPEALAWSGGPSAVAVDAAGNLFIAASTRVLRMDAKTGVLSAVAGSGTVGYGGDNGPATSAKLGPLGGIAVDRAGNLYIADWGNHRVRKVSHGVITTVAGTGVGGYNGDGPAIACQLKLPHGVAVDAAGNLYIADYGNARIREVSGGVMTTVAGTGRLGFGGDNGPATRAALVHPFGVAVDSSGNLYIADADERRIRKVSHGVITTLAGDGTASYNGDGRSAAGAELNAPSGVAVDSKGNLYIADAGNNRVREVSNGLISTVAGNGSSGFDDESGPAANAMLIGPLGVAVDSKGNLYIADWGHNRVLKVSNGVYATVAGNGHHAPRPAGK